VLDLLDPHGDTREQAELINFVRKGYAPLEGFVQKGLDYFQWLAAERPGGAEVTDLAAVVQRVADHLVRPAKTGVDCQISVPGVPCLVRGREKHLAAVVQILLDNALKFSGEETFIRAAVRDRRGGDPDGGRPRARVRAGVGARIVPAIHCK